MPAWRRLHQLHWLARWPLKWLLLTMVVALTLYPKFWLIPRVAERLRDVETVIDPNHPAIAELAGDVRLDIMRTAIGADPNQADLERMLAMVERVVYERVPYAFDWETWGVMLYIPSVDEVFARGQEDCDGRAIVATSLLRHMGYDAWVTSDIQHAWVQTPFGETMSPGAGAPTAGQHAPGEQSQIELSWETTANAVRGVRFALLVFPLWRLLLITLAIWALAAHPWSSMWRRIVGGALLLLALAFFRDAGPRLYTGAEFQHLAWLGLATLTAGWLLLAVRGRRTVFERAAQLDAPMSAD